MFNPCGCNKLDRLKINDPVFIQKTDENPNIMKNVGRPSKNCQAVHVKRLGSQNCRTSELPNPLPIVESGLGPAAHRYPSTHRRSCKAKSFASSPIGKSLPSATEKFAPVRQPCNNESSENQKCTFPIRANFCTFRSVGLPIAYPKFSGLSCFQTLQKRN